MSSAPACAVGWRLPAACSCGRSSLWGGSGAGAGAARPTTSTSRSTDGERPARTLERQAELLPLVLAARVVADVRIAELAQAPRRLDRVVAVGVRAVDDDLRVECRHALRAADRLDRTRRHVDRSG